MYHSICTYENTHTMKQTPDTLIHWTQCNDENTCISV